MKEADNMAKILPGEYREIRVWCQIKMLQPGDTIAHLISRISLTRHHFLAKLPIQKKIQSYICLKDTTAQRFFILLTQKRQLLHKL